MRGNAVAFTADKQFARLANNNVFGHYSVFTVSYTHHSGFIYEKSIPDCLNKFFYTFLIGINTLLFQYFCEICNALIAKSLL